MTTKTKKRGLVMISNEVSLKQEYKKAIKLEKLTSNLFFLFLEIFSKAPCRLLLYFPILLPITHGKQTTLLPSWDFSLLGTPVKNHGQAQAF